MDFLSGLKRRSKYTELVTVIYRSLSQMCVWGKSVGGSGDKLKARSRKCCLNDGSDTDRMLQYVICQNVIEKWVACDKSVK